MALVESKPKRRWFRRREQETAEKQLTMTPDFVEGLRSWWPMQMEPLYGAGVEEAQTGDYGHLYLHQPAVRTTVDFLASNMAPLKIHTYRKTPSGSPEELDRHPAHQLLQNPNPGMTRYDLIYATVAARRVYENAFWWLTEFGGERQIRFLPPEMVRVEGNAWIGPARYRIIPNRYYDQRTEFYLAPQDVVHFKSWNPKDMRVGISKLEGLRSVLVDDALASTARAAAWRNTAMMANVIERGLDAPDWSDKARERFREDFQATYGGAGQVGKTGVLEEGMSMNWGPDRRPWDTEYVAGRKFTLEEVARALHIPLSMLGLMSNANYKATSEERRTLYADVLDSEINMIEETLELQYLPWFGDALIDKVYFKFNIKEKLRGSFQEEADLFTKSAGRPWLSVNEVRALQDLPPAEGGDGLVIPLNVMVGGQPNPSTPTATPAGPLFGAPTQQAATAKSASDDEHALHARFLTRARTNFEEKTRQVMTRHFGRQRSAGFNSKSLERWNRELADDLYGTALVTASYFGEDAAERVGGSYDPDFTVNYLRAGADVNAQLINRATKDELEEDDPAEVFKRALEVRAQQIAVSRTTVAMNFGIQEAGRQNSG